MKEPEEVRRLRGTSGSKGTKGAPAARGAREVRGAGDAAPSEQLEEVLRRFTGPSAGGGQSEQITED